MTTAMKDQDKNTQLHYFEAIALTTETTSLF